MLTLLEVRGKSSAKEVLSWGQETMLECSVGSMFLLKKELAGRTQTAETAQEPELTACFFLCVKYPGVPGMFYRDVCHNSSAC